MSPDDYRRAAGYRRSEAPRLGPARALQATAFTSFDDPALSEFLTGRKTVTGTMPSDRRAMRNSVFYRATSLIAGSIGMLPVHLIRRRADGRTEKAKDHPLYKVLHRRPNSYQTAIEFKSYLQLIALLDGNAYALVTRQAGRISELIPLPRKAVTPKLTESFKLYFEYRRPSGGTVRLEQRDVFCFRSPMSLDGMNGLGLLEIASDTLALAYEAQRSAGRLVTKGMMAGGSLETSATLGEEAIENLKRSLAENYAGSDATGDWMVLEEGLTAKPFAGSAKEAQLAEMRKMEAEEVSRFTGAPRPLLMFDETSWGSGIEQLGLFFVTYCLMMWFIVWEEAIWRLLEDREQEAPDGSILYAKFNERALLRGSMKDQAEFMARAMGSGGGQPWQTQNETREAFDQNPLPGGDELPRAGTTAATMVEEAENEAA